MSDLPDEELVSGSAEAPDLFDEIVRRHADAICGYLRRRLDRDRALELTNETFQIAFDARGSYEPVHATAAPWLYGIARNLVRQDRRAHAKHLRLVRNLSSEPVHVPTDTTSGAVLDAELADAIRQAVGDLPVDQRDVVELVLWENLSYEAVAEVVDAPIGTVRSRLSRARSRIRNALEDQGHIQRTKKVGQ